MPNTTNYNWVTPADSDLVKDGAAAIRTLGSSIDTTVKSLNAGTTAGDLDYYTSATAKQRIAIGTSGQLLSVSGGVPAWTTVAIGGMTLLSTTTLSALQTTVSSINQTYNSLYIYILNMTGNASFVQRIDPNATTGLARTVTNPATTVTNFEGQGTTSFPTTGINATTMTIDNYASTSAPKTVQYWGSHSGGTNPSFSVQGIINTASAITSIRVTTVAGTTTIGGTMLIYGVK
jgi:hypothetical protein